MVTDPTRMCELLVGLPEVTVLGLEDEVGAPLYIHVETRARRPGCSERGLVGRSRLLREGVTDDPLVWLRHPKFTPPRSRFPDCQGDPATGYFDDCAHTRKGISGVGIDEDVAVGRDGDSIARSEQVVSAKNCGQPRSLGSP